MSILVTGGAGYIGSHTCLALLQADHDIIIVDNLANSKKEALKRIQTLSGKNLTFHEVDLLDEEALEAVFAESSIEAVIHFAGLKSVPESVARPLHYYRNNVLATLVLCQVMARHNVKTLVFSSSCTVYGEPHKVPVTEDFPRSATNPYGRSKLIIEDMFYDLHRADDSWQVTLLRYFNPVGAHNSGMIGEDPNGVPGNLLPYIAQVAVGKRSELSVYGNDYPTPDGTGIRDYIHVVDLAAGHLKALQKLDTRPGIIAYNLGTGKGYSVLDVIAAFEKVTGKKIPYRIADRRPGDVAVSYGDPTKAKEELGWVAERDLEDMCADVWRWQSKNPNGYG